MVVSTLRRPLPMAALALCSAAFVAFASPASARSIHHQHGYRHHAHAAHGSHYASRHGRHVRSIARLSRRDRSIAQSQSEGFDDAQANLSSSGMSSGFGLSNVVSEARRYLGGNPTSRSTLWCARFMNMVLERTGHRGTGSDLARSFASYGQRVSGPQVGAIAVMARRGGGHVGVVSGVDAQGNPIVISGNSHNRVRETPISRGRVYAYVMPN